MGRCGAEVAARHSERLSELQDTRILFHRSGPQTGLNGSENRPLLISF